MLAANITNNSNMISIQISYYIIVINILLLELIRIIIIDEL